MLCVQMLDCIRFQSTPSVWRETFHDRNPDFCKSISIHSLRVEGDSSAPCSCTMRTISIHSLRVEGDVLRQNRPYIVTISIHSLRVEGDVSTPATVNVKDISIHSLRVEGDRKIGKNAKSTGLFQSTPSVWRETVFLNV